MKILVCDRCGLAITDREDVWLALDGKDAWAEATQTRGNEPRGVFPCKDYAHCSGEMKPVDSNVYWWRQQFMKLRRH